MTDQQQTEKPSPLTEKEQAMLKRLWSADYALGKRESKRLLALIRKQEAYRDAGASHA